jgi:hypothetical protein
VKQLVPAAEAIDTHLVDFLWGDEIDNYSTTQSRNPFATPTPGTPRTPSTPSSGSSAVGVEASSRLPDALAVPGEERVGTSDPEKTMHDIEDPEKAAVMAARKVRPVHLFSSISQGFAAGLAVVLMSLGLRRLASTSR